MPLARCRCRLTAIRGLDPPARDILRVPPVLGSEPRGKCISKATIVGPQGEARPFTAEADVTTTTARESRDPRCEVIGAIPAKTGHVRVKKPEN